MEFYKTVALSFLIFAVVECTFTDIYTRSIADKDNILSLYRIFWDCFDSDKDMSICLKSQVLYLLDGSMKKEVVPLLKGISLKKVKIPGMKDDIDLDEEEDRSLSQDRSNATSIDEKIWKRLKHLFQTRILDIDASTLIEEGRKKKGKEFGHMLMIAMLTKAMLVGHMALKGIVLLAGKALILAKIAIIISSIVALKKHSSHDGEKRSRDFNSDVSVETTTQLLPSKNPLSPYRFYERQLNFNAKDK